MDTADQSDEASLRDLLAERLLSNGSVWADVDQLTDGSQSWRRTARAAARSIGRPVQTLEGLGAVHAVLRDWPANPQEDLKHRLKLRQVVDALAITGSATSAQHGANLIDSAVDTMRNDRGAGASVATVELVSLERNVASEFEQVPAVGTVVAIRREASLVADFAAHLRAQGHVLGRHRIQGASGENPLATDLFDTTAQVLYEAKSSVDRTTIRLGLGQILDYRRFLDGVITSCQLLLPARPSGDLVELLAHYRVGVTWRDGDNWRGEPSP